MPKPVPLTPAVMQPPQIVPASDPSARPVQSGASTEGTKMPLQVRLPRDEVRAIKVAAAERDQTVSEFMLACFHAYMQREGEK
jgi:hypothetical protein